MRCFISDTVSWLLIPTIRHGLMKSAKSGNPLMALEGSNRLIFASKLIISMKGLSSNASAVLISFASPFPFSIDCLYLKLFLTKNANNSLKDLSTMFSAL